jgi:predicted nucleotidyltransferase
VAEHDAYVAAYRRRWAAEAEAATERAASLRRLASRLAEVCWSYGATRVILFGSAARGATRSDGGLDIAVAGVSPERFFALYGRLLAESPVSVDLVDLDDCPEALRESVEREGVPLS